MSCSSLRVGSQLNQFCQSGSYRELFMELTVVIVLEVSFLGDFDWPLTHSAGIASFSQIFLKSPASTLPEVLSSAFSISTCIASALPANVNVKDMFFGWRVNRVIWTWQLSTLWKFWAHLVVCSCSVQRMLTSSSLIEVDWMIYLPLTFVMP